mmetsp:Transcript_1096/g.895  ORF Transcript_1096/g.895 Transcript_1096/m.895 type:complete len:120 (-) Transcript_1096:281-640(-)
MLFLKQLTSLLLTLTMFMDISKGISAEIIACINRCTTICPTTESTNACTAYCSGEECDIGYQSCALDIDGSGCDTGKYSDGTRACYGYAFHGYGPWGYDKCKETCGSEACWYCSDTKCW